MTECVIAGLFTSEILDMTHPTRCRWYKKIAPEEREMAKQIVDRVGRVKNSEAKSCENNRGENHPMFGKSHSEETKAKLHDALSGENNPMFGKSHSEETKDKLREALTGRTLSEETRKKLSAKGQGISIDEWKGYVSFLPYCPAFKFSLKEHIRNRYHRACVICGKSALQQLGRLSVHHLDEVKLQGCDDWEWRLAVLCRSCHTRMHGQDLTPLLQLLLLNNRWHQTSFLWVMNHD